MSATSPRYGEELSININSPGTFSLRTKNGFALVVLALFVLTQVDPATAMNAQIGVQTIPVGSADNQCATDIAQSVHAYLDTLGHERWKDACEIAERMRQDAAVSVPGRLQAAR